MVNPMFHSHSFVRILIPSLRENFSGTHLCPLSAALPMFMKLFWLYLHFIYFCVLSAWYRWSVSHY